ncbi:unnamed protein product [Rotaria sp. Silwood1]|nr:unnamed protein product [Rotaria sp. Silwood1]
MGSVESSSYKKRSDNQRFIDVGKEPDKILPPLPSISQLHSSASSLHEAVKPIHHLVEDLPYRVAYSLERCKNPKDGLTPDESAAIFLYTQQWPPEKTSFYTMFNRTLRDENRAKLAPFHQYFNLFMSVFNKLPSIQDRVWRGETGDWGDQYKQGMEAYKIFHLLNHCTRFLS